MEEWSNKTTVIKTRVGAGSKVVEMHGCFKVHERNWNLYLLGQLCGSERTNLC